MVGDAGIPYSGTQEGTLPGTRKTGREVKEMQKFTGGQEVGMGTYWESRTGRMVEMKKEGILPGNLESKYSRIPFAILFLYAVVSGGLYIVFLPVTIIAVSLYLLGRRVFGGVLGQLRTSVSFGWRPTEAYLAGKNKKEKHSNGTKE
jgi:hypothetical protein